MDHTYWHKQTPGKALFPELVWSRPENKAHAGKLLIIGGNAHGFAAAAEAYSEALKSGVGLARVLLPDCLRKTVGKIFAGGEFAPSTPSGSFSGKSLAEFLDASLWADGVLLAGDLGKNSETAALIENFSQKYSGQLTITQDAADYFIDSSPLFSRPKTTLVLGRSQLQKFVAASRQPTAITSGMDLLKLIEALHETSNFEPLNFITIHQQNILVAVDGQVGSTKLAAGGQPEIIKISAGAAVWWLQNPAQTFEALSSAVLGNNLT
ncbi:MAG: hypothetical protein ACREGF_04775 [Candidatus Saccharimonadales bacterium]